MTAKDLGNCAQTPTTYHGGRTVEIDTARGLARKIDISCVRTQHTEEDIRALAALSVKWDFINAHVLPHWVPLIKTLLVGSNTLVGAPAGFPSGGSSTTTKLKETQFLLENGVEEIDVVMNVGRFLSGDFAYVEHELKDILQEINASIPVKIIIETPYLSIPQIRLAAKLCADVGANFIKTGTGWAGPVTVDGVKAIAESIAPPVMIKAAGGIRTLEHIKQLAGAGATRFGVGVTAAIDLVQQLEGQTNQ